MKKTYNFKRAIMSFLFIFTMIGLTQAQSVIANWNFNALPEAPNTPTVITADVGTGTIYLDGTHGADTWLPAADDPQLNSFSGYADGDVPSGQALALVGQSANGQAAVFAFSTTQMENIQVTFHRRGTSTGFDTHVWSYSIDNGATFVPIAGNNTARRPTTFALATIDLSAITDLNNQTAVYLKLVVNGATSTSGNSRIDNFTITGTAATATVATPVITTLPVADVGQLNVYLGTVYLSGGVAEYNGTPVPGTFAWTDPTQTLTTTGTATYNVTFTPTNTDAYATVQFDVEVTVVGACVAIAPWTYGFEDGSHDVAIAGCFSQLKDGGTGSNSWTYNKTYTTYGRIPHSGSMNAFLRYGNTRWLFREVYFSPGTYQFSIYARQDGATATNAKLTVKLGTENTSAAMAAGVVVVPETGLINGDYQLLTGTINITTAGVYTLGIKGEINSSPWYISIDDIAIQNPNCLTPQVAVSNITTNSALVTITSTASNFVVQYKEKTAAVWQTIYTSNTTVTLTGLTDASDIDVRVKANCDGGSTSGFGIASFRTLCHPATVPYFYGFEDGAHAATVDLCYSQVAETGTSNWVYNRTFTTYNRTPHSGEANATLYYSNTRWLFKEMFFQPGTYRFSMFARQDGSVATNASITVKVGTAATVAGMSNGDVVIAATGLVNGNYQELVGQFTITTAGVYYVGIRGYISSSPYYISIDDIAIEDMNCLTPEIAVSNVTAGTALVAITSTLENFTLEYKEPTATTWNTLQVSGTTVTLTGLTDDTDYEVRVKANCDGGQYSGYATASFRTLCLPVAIPYFYSFEDGTDAQPVDLCFIQEGVISSSTLNEWMYNSSLTTYNREPLTGTTNATLRWGNTRWLFKEMTLEPGRYEFVMYARQDGSTPEDASITVKLGTAPTIAAMDAGTVVVAETGLVNGDYQELAGRINITTAGVYSIGIKGAINSSPYYISIDDISVTVLECLRPESVAVSNISTTSADITIVPDEDGDETAWVLEYKVTTDTVWTVMPVTNTSVTLTGLTLATNYSVRAKAVCSATSESGYVETSFWTGCGALPTVPFYYSFENGVHDTPIDICFTQEAVSGTDAWTFNRTYTDYGRTPRTGEYNAYLKYSNNRWLFMEISLDPGLYEFGIYARQDVSSGATLTVKVGTAATATAMADGITVIDQAPVVSGDYQHFYNPFAIQTAGTYVIGINAALTASPWYISIDDISVTEITCPQPTSITASNVLSSSAQIDFVPGGNETAWVLEYKASTDANWTIMPLTNTSVTLTGLEMATNYTARVKAVCTTDDESRYVSTDFTTICGLATVPFYYGFENGTHGAPVDICFTQEGVSGSSQWYFNKTITSYNRTPRSGEYNAYLQYGNDRWLFKEFSLDPGYYEFGMYARQDMTSGATLTVKVGTAASATAMANGISLIDQVPVVDGDYQHFTALFTIETAGTYVIGINAALNYTPWYVSIDDISLVGTTCPRPVSVTFNNITTNTANITVVPYGNETSWIVEYKKVTDETWTTRTITNPTVNLTGLAHSTVYDLRVKAICAADDHSNYFVTQFATVFQVPFYEPFSTDQTPTAWTNVKADQTTTSAGTFNFPTTGTYPTCSPVVGPYMARFNAYNYSTGTEGDLITPQINGIGTGSLIKFWMYRDSYSAKEEGIRVMVNNAPTSEGATLLNTIYRSRNSSPTVSTAGWYQYVVRVPSTGFNRVIFEGFSAYGYNIFIDEIEVTAPYYTPVIITNGPNGNSNPNGNITVLNGTDRLINFVPAQGYRVASITVNGTEVQGPDLTNSRPFQYTLSVGLDTTYVHATYEKIPYTITPSITNYHGNLYLDNGNIPGTITPNQPTIVLHGESQIFTINVNPNYHLYELLIDGVNQIADVIAMGNNAYTYEFTNVTADHTIEAIVKIDTIAIEYNVVSGAGIIDGIYVAGPTIHNTYVNYGDDFLATMPAAPGYTCVSTTVNGQYVGAASQYQLYNIQTVQHIALEYQANPITITTQAYGNGTITPGTTFIYDPAYVYDYVVTPATGNYVSAVLVNDVPQTIADNALYNGQLTNITENQVIKAYFEPLTYQVVATAGVGGAVTPAGTQTYAYGATQQYVVTAAEGYTITSVEVDGIAVTVPVGATSYTYTFNNIVANHTIAATFAINTYTITATAGANGTVTPAGATTLNYNDDLTYTITPNAGYHIVDVLVDGISVGAVSQYNFVDVQENHTISATFAINTYTITASINGNGTITPAGVTTVNHGGNQTYTITPALGSLIMDVLVDGVSQGAITSYTFTNVTADHVIYVVTNTATFNITVTQPNHGTITPGSHTVLYGATPTFTVVPNTGYNVSAVQVNGSSVAITPNNIGVVTHTLNPVSANVTIAATMAIKTYTITASAGANGTITPSGAATVNYGASSQVYQFNPAAGYVVDNVTIDGIAMGALPSYQFAHVTANHTINVTFKLIECETPANTYTTLITQTTATFNWNVTDAASYSVQYKKLSDANFTMVNNVNNTWLDVTGLTANTQYMWQVRSNCSATNYSEWSMVNTFVTLPTLPDAVDEYDLSNLQVYSYYSDLFIVNNGAFALESAEIFDSYGKLVYSTTLNTNSEVITLDVATGIYFVKVYTTQGAAAYKVHITK